jgi:hypothetical protein
MKELLIVGAYVRTEESEAVLSKAIERVSPHFDIALVTHTPVSQKIQEQVKYFIYDQRNELMYDKISTVFWGDYGWFYYEIHPDGTRAYHSFAMYRSLTNAIKLLSAEYDCFTYIEGDSIYSPEDVITLKNMRDLAKSKNKRAMFISYGDFLSTNVFYSEMEFFRDSFKFFKNSDEFIEASRLVGSHGLLENYLYKAGEHLGILKDINILDGMDKPDGTPGERLFKSSEINKHSSVGKGESKPIPYFFEVVKIEGTTDLALIYLNHSKEADTENYPFYIDDDFVQNLGAVSYFNVIKIFPKKEQFCVKIGDNKIMFDKSKILNQSNKSFLRFK